MHRVARGPWSVFPLFAVLPVTLPALTPPPPNTICFLLPFPPSISHSIFLVLCCLDLSLDISVLAGCPSISCLSQSLLPPSPAGSLSSSPPPLPSSSFLLPLLFSFFPSTLSFVTLSLSFPLMVTSSMCLCFSPSVPPLLLSLSLSVSLASALMVPLPVSIFIFLTHLLCPLLRLSVSPPPASPQVPAPGPN